MIVVDDFEIYFVLEPRRSRVGTEQSVNYLYLRVGDDF